MPEVFLTPAAVDDLRRLRSEVAGLQVKPPRSGGAHARELSTWVTITSTTKTSGRYPGTIWTRDEANAAWVEGEACWVDTPNGATLATSTYYRAVVTDPSLGPGGSERPVVQVTGLSGSITVEEQDGSPSYTGITTVQADQAAGFVVTNPAAGKALVSQTAASASAVGYVTTGTQTFAGTKTFQDDVYVDDDHLVVGLAFGGSLTTTAHSRIQQDSTSPFATGSNGFVSWIPIASNGKYAAIGTVVGPTQVNGWELHDIASGDTEWARFYGTLSRASKEGTIVFSVQQDAYASFGAQSDLLTLTFTGQSGTYAGLATLYLKSGSGGASTFARYGVIREGATYNGGTATTGGLTFAGGLYISGTLTAGDVSDGDTLATGLTFPETGLAVLDDDASHTLKLTTSPLTANKTLEFELTGTSAILQVSSSGAQVSGSNTGDVTLAGTPNYLTIAGQVITCGLIDLSTDVTGALPLSGLATQSNQTILANVSGGVAVPSAVSLSSILDIASSTRGTILYRGASGWAALPTGTAGYYLQTAGAGNDPSWADVTTAVASASTTVAGKVELATTAEVATGTDTARAVTPQGVGWHQGAAKSWLNFNGTGTIAIRDSYNITSITDVGTGNYTVNLDTDHASANYAAVATAGVSGNRVYTDLAAASIFAVGSYRIITSDAAGTLIDADVVCGVTFGDW